MNKIILLAAMATAIVCTGCITSNKTVEATLVGEGIYLATTKVEQKVNKPEFHDKVSNLWAKIDSIQTVDEIEPVWAEVTAAFDEVIDSKDITVGQKTVLKSFRKVLDTQVVSVMNATFTPNSEALKYIRNVREGIRIMIKAESGIEVEVSDDEGADPEDLAAGTSSEAAESTTSEETSTPAETTTETK